MGHNIVYIKVQGFEFSIQWPQKFHIDLNNYNWLPLKRLVTIKYPIHVYTVTNIKVTGQLHHITLYYKKKKKRKKLKWYY